MTKIKSVLEMVRIHQHAKFKAIPHMRTQETAQKAYISPVSLGQNTSKMMKIIHKMYHNCDVWQELIEINQNDTYLFSVE